MDITPAAEPAAAPALAPDAVPVVPDLDHEAMTAARHRQGLLTKPPGALGRLEDLSVWIAGAQGTCPPRPLRRVRVVVIAGDHGIATAGVSAFPSEVTAQMVANFAAGGAAVNVLARQVGASVRVVDVAVDTPVPTTAGGADGSASPERYRVRRGSGRIDRTDALTAAEVDAAFAVGRLIADEEIDAGADLLVPGEMGIGNTTPAAAVVGTLLDREPIEVVGRGTGIDDERWMLKTAAIRDAMRRARPYAGNARSVLRVAGGADLAALAGLLVQAGVRRTPVVLDGVIVCAAALAAEMIAPGAKRWWVAGTRSTEPAQRLVLDHLGLEPLLDAGLRLGEGTGALLAVPMLTAAQATLAEMATFDQAGVSAKEPAAPDTADTTDTEPGDPEPGAPASYEPPAVDPAAPGPTGSGMPGLDLGMLGLITPDSTQTGPTPAEPAADRPGADGPGAGGTAGSAP
ncbi:MULTISPECIES: nicotinate-nucleotide--dimethylbenzimidazole phosphoribosyltransferase [unclassified Parafrankia]|uniref:nicotinate-nucleotide--dimethylbenzimidazole phosphoribosyltransferase n=1 Tax=unclassified Parafrankia TaxID=2994368 RepID=UPI000DA581A1|nr:MULTISPECIES: nicotinate-nucleotide--dimethylbenzimidazole phosphoribosyltransferase [unclassified Parafrankia]SQE00681.1 Nicotinate-nucleotide--dimethylbenzimidazole phosphoribosyltransferase [Parafrankia sp. Ea1.12]